MKKEAKMPSVKQDSLTIEDEAVGKRHNGKVYFQHKIDRVLDKFSQTGLVRLVDKNASPTDLG